MLRFKAAWYCTRERERNVLFNDTLNTFYLRLYGVRHMVEDHSDSERGNPLPPHGLLFLILYCRPIELKKKSSQWSITGVTKAVICAILSVG